MKQKEGGGYLLHYNREKEADIRFQDGSLRHVKGVLCYQVHRANGQYTYNHAPMIACWKGRFFIEYLSNKQSEHVPPSRTFLTWSKNGYDWADPQEVFPEIKVPSNLYKGIGKEYLREEETPCIMHQRMGFYVSANKRLYVMGFYGISPKPNIAPNKGYGVGRVIREIKEDLTWSNIYFIYFNEAVGFTRENTKAFPIYTESNDEEFIRDCNEILNHPLVIKQWWEEQRYEAIFQGGEEREAFCYYTCPSGKIYGFYKNGYVTSSLDGGHSWSDIVYESSIVTSTGKIWAQKTSGEKYVLIYNPSKDSQHRWPLALNISEDGENYENMLCITPEISPCRYPGLYKNLGAQYVRGICEYNPQPKDGGIWITYSVNKEDIWVARIPADLSETESTKLNEVFDDFLIGAYIPNWNIYGPRLCKVRVEEYHGKRRLLMLYDKDPFDRARAMRIFPETQHAVLEITCIPFAIEEHAKVTIEIQNHCGNVPVAIYFDPDQSIYVKNSGVNYPIATYVCGREYKIQWTIDCINSCFKICIEDGKSCYEKRGAFSQNAWSVERILFTTKENLPYQTLEDNGKWGEIIDRREDDIETRESQFGILSLSMIE